MKTIGVILIILCVVVNVFVGLFLYESSLPTSVEIGEQTLLEKTYKNYGFAISIPESYQSLGSNIGINLLESFGKKTSDPVLDIFVFGNITIDSSLSSEEYKILSQKFFESKNSGSLTYIDAGIVTNQNGVKLYYDILSGPGEDGIIYTLKNLSLYKDSNLVQIIFTDTSENYPHTVVEFDSMIDTIRIY